MSSRPLILCLLLLGVASANGADQTARIIEQHGGRLEFDTQVGKGTIFRIVLPTVSKEPIA